MKPERQQAIPDSTVEFKAVLKGTPPFKIKWFKDGKQISTSAKYRLVCHENTVSLDVNNLELEDTANYTCRVSNVAGDAACSGILTVKG